jgi:Protein of unknown function (DUF3999)
MRKVFMVSAWLVAAAASAADEPAFRYSAPITVSSPGAFVQLPLPAAAYGRSASSNLADLRIVDARGERVPFAVLAPRQPEAQTTEQQRDATLYPLPAKPAADGTWTAPIEVTVDGDRISVKRLASGTAGTTVAPATTSAGWLFDLGERKRDDPAPQSLRIAWSGPAEFTAAFRFDTSDDLRQWRSGGSGQLMALASPSGPLVQPTLVLGANPGRFVRLVWTDAASAPQVSAAKVIAAQHGSKVLDAPVIIVASPSAEPAGKTAADEAAQRALHFDLGGTLPITQVDLRWTSGTLVAPVRLQARDDANAAWRELGAAVFYRLERGTEVASSPPLPVTAHARYVRVLPDPRAAALDAAQTQLVVQAPLASLVFAAQGQPPYTLQAGAKVTAPSALPVASLVPSLDKERERFGSATLGQCSEVSAVARAEQAQQQRAALRPWLLWSVLLAGVAVLGFMVWRLARPTRQNERTNP